MKKSLRPVAPIGPDMELIPLYLWWRRSVVDTVDHEEVVCRIVEESGFSPRYIFMSMMSAGIAVLGLLLSSPAVVIGAMLISPLMGPILGIGFGLALFDFRELRRAVVAFVIGALVAVAFAAAIVLASPLQATTQEIVSRTRPNLFDLLVALFAALAGTFAIIRGRGDTIAGVAIATALMPPLAVVAYGAATWNLPVFTGSLELFTTNFLTIALAATIMARIYGFGHHLSRKQTLVQTAVLMMAFVAMGVPLGLALRQIAREAVFVVEVRTALADRFGPNSRVTQLDVDFHQTPWAVRTVVIAPRSRAASAPLLKRQLEKRLGRPLNLQLNQVLVDPTQGPRGERRAQELANVAALGRPDRGARIAELVALAAGVPADRVTVDRERQRAIAAAAPLPGAALASYYALEQRATADANGWTVEITPPSADLPLITFQSGKDTLDGGGRQAVQVSAWAAQRWNIPALRVPGLPPTPPKSKALSLSARRALAVADVLRQEGLAALPAPSAGASFRLSAARPGG